MYYYETKPFSVLQLSKFIKWYDKVIGTDYEVNEDEDKVSIMCIEVTIPETKKIENKIDELNSIMEE